MIWFWRKGIHGYFRTDARCRRLRVFSEAMQRRIRSSTDRVPGPLSRIAVFVYIQLCRVPLPEELARAFK